MCFVSDFADYFGGLNFVIFSPTFGSPFPRRDCLFLTIFRDSIYENAETFEIDLNLDIYTSGVILDPDVISVTILDVNGKSYNAFWCAC